MTPRPPERDTAEARGVVEVWAMPARRIGWVIERTWVSGVVRVGVREEGGIVLEGGEEVRRREQG
jgi:predicted sugar kinase